MRIRKARLGHLLLMATIAALAVTPLAIAEASGGSAAKTAAASKRITALTKRLGQLEASLTNRIAALETRVIPTELPPKGPAGGDLTGSYPNPQIGPDKVGSAQIATAAVGFSELAPNSVGAIAFRSATAVVGTGVAVAAGETKTATVTCPAGSRLLGGGFEWGSANGNGTAVISSSPTFVGDANVTWEVQGRVDTGGNANTIFAEALCLGV